MDRQELLDALARYQHTYPREGDTCRRFVNFVREDPYCFERDNWFGHITGSAWLLNPAGTHLLLTHHKKLDMWLQLGGHSDGEVDTQRVAMREAAEESGIGVELLSPEILDIDIHTIPARKSDPAHLHFDIRFALVAAGDDFVISDESHSLAWVEVSKLETHTRETSILRMREKWQKHPSRLD